MYVDLTRFRANDAPMKIGQFYACMAFVANSLTGFPDPGRMVAWRSWYFLAGVADGAIHSRFVQENQSREKTQSGD